MKRLNIGCGRDYRDGWINIDISKNCKADLYLDIRKDTLMRYPPVSPIEIRANDVDEIYISGVLEQIGDNDQFIFAMNECWRALKPGGVMTLVVPDARFAIAHQDPMDVRKFTLQTFDYFLKGNRKHDLYGSVYGLIGWSKALISENERHIFTVEMIK